MMIEKREVNGFTVEFHYDEDAESPRSWTHGCELVLSHRRYDLPNDAGIRFDDFAGWGEVAAHLKEHEGALVVMPVYAYEHSGIALRAADADPFHDPWDSGVLGLAYVTPKNWEETQGGVFSGSDGDIEQAKRLIKSEVDVYGMYLNGECYWYAIKDFDGEVVDSCGGYIGFDDVEKEAVRLAKELEHEPKCTGTLNRASSQVEHTRECPIHK